MLPRTLSAMMIAASLCACVTDDGPTDIRGRSLKIDDAGGFQPAESRFNTFMFLKPSSEYVTKARERNNGQGWTETVEWNKGREFVEIEFINTAWFSQGTERNVSDQSNFERLARKFSMPSDSFVKIDQVSPRIKGWIAQNGICSVGSFAKRFKGLTPYDNDRGLSDAVVYFGTCGDDFTVTPEEFAQKIDLITKDDKAHLVSAYAGLKPVSAKKKPTHRDPLVSLTGRWDGVSETMSGAVERQTAGQITFSATLTDTGTDCTGTAVTAQKTTMTGTWTLTCANGLAADGIWTYRDNQPFVASGSDSEKRRVTFELKS